MPKVFTYSRKNLISSQISNVVSTDLFVNSHLNGERPLLSATPNVINLPSDGTPALINVITQNSDYFLSQAKNVADLRWDWEIDGVVKSDDTIGFTYSNLALNVVGKHNIRMRVKEGEAIGLWSSFVSVIVESPIEISTPTLINQNASTEDDKFVRYEYDPQAPIPEIIVYLGDDNTINLNVENILDTKTNYLRWNIFDIMDSITKTIVTPDHTSFIDHNENELSDVVNRFSGTLGDNDKFVSYSKTNTQLIIDLAPSSPTNLQPISNEPLVKEVSVTAYNSDGTSSNENKVIYKIFNPRVQNPFKGWRPQIGSSFFNGGSTIYANKTNVDLYLKNTETLPDTVVNPTYTWDLGNSGYIVSGHGLNQITGKWEDPGLKYINLKMEQDSYCVHTKFVECDENNPHPENYERILQIVPPNPFGSWTPLIAIDTEGDVFVDGQEIKVVLDGSYPETLDSTAVSTWEVFDKNNDDQPLDNSNYDSDSNNVQNLLVFNIIGKFGVRLKVEQDGYSVHSNEVILDILSNIVNVVPSMTHGTQYSLDNLPLYVSHTTITGITISTSPSIDFQSGNYYFCYYVNMNATPPTNLAEFTHVPASRVTDINNNGFPEMGVTTPGRYFVHFFFTMDSDKRNLVRNSQMGSSEYMVEYNLSKLTENGYLEIEIEDPSEYYFYRDPIDIESKVKAGMEAFGIKPDHVEYEWDEPSNSNYIENTTSSSDKIKLKIDPPD